MPGLGGSNLETAPSTSLRVGDRVYAIGAPHGLELTLSEGLVSALRSVGGDQVIEITTAPISPGSSGGGLFDERSPGSIGITSFKSKGGENLNFAWPMDLMGSMVSLNVELVDRWASPFHPRFLPVDHTGNLTALMPLQMYGRAQDGAKILAYIKNGTSCTITSVSITLDGAREELRLVGTVGPGETGRFSGTAPSPSEWQGREWKLVRRQGAVEHEPRFQKVRSPSCRCRPAKKTAPAVPASDRDSIARLAAAGGARLRLLAAGLR